VDQAISCTWEDIGRPRWRSFHQQQTKSEAMAWSEEIGAGCEGHYSRSSRRPDQGGRGRLRAPSPIGKRLLPWRRSSPVAERGQLTALINCRHGVAEFFHQDTTF
jgi:hypothetical protein